MHVPFEWKPHETPNGEESHTLVLHFSDVKQTTRDDIDSTLSPLLDNNRRVKQSAQGFVHVKSLSTEPGNVSMTAIALNGDKLPIYRLRLPSSTLLNSSQYTPLQLQNITHPQAIGKVKNRTHTTNLRGVQMQQSQEVEESTIGVRYSH